MKYQRIFGVVACCFAAFGLNACEDDNPASSALSKSVSLCETSMKRSQLVEMLDGNLAIVAGFSEDGWSATEIVGGFITGFVVNTIDFEALNKWDAEFSGGRYRVRNGGNTLDLFLIFGETFGNYQPGDTLKENLFSPSSYVRNVSVNLSGASYDQGPLFDLIAGGISWSGVKPRLRVDVTRLRLGVVSNGNWKVRWSNTEVDTIRTRMASFPLDIGALKGDFGNGVIGFSYDSTRHASISRKLTQGIFQSGFSMKPLDGQGARWSWEGEYRSLVDKVFQETGVSLRFHIRGSVSTVGGNSSAYFCDEALQDSIGVAVEDTSLTWGYFKSVNGDSIAYGLVPARK